MEAAYNPSEARKALLKALWRKRLHRPVPPDQDQMYPSWASRDINHPQDDCYLSAFMSGLEGCLPCQMPEQSVCLQIIDQVFEWERGDDFRPYERFSYVDGIILGAGCQLLGNTTFEQGQYDFEAKYCIFLTFPEGQWHSRRSYYLRIH